MSKAIITLQFTVGLGYRPGDYAMLVGNGGSGEIDYDNPLTSERFELFPDGAGIYGWGHAPWGHFGWGHAWSINMPGWGHFPWGHGAVTIKARVTVFECGNYKLAFKCYDVQGNEHVGTPDVAEFAIHIAPDAPLGLKKHSYNKDTKVLVFDIAA